MSRFARLLLILIITCVPSNAFSNETLRSNATHVEIKPVFNGSHDWAFAVSGSIFLGANSCFADGVVGYWVTERAGEEIYVTPMMTLPANYDPSACTSENDAVYSFSRIEMRLDTFEVRRIVVLADEGRPIVLELNP